MTLALRIDWSPEASTASVIDVAATQVLAESTQSHRSAGVDRDLDDWLRSTVAASRDALDALVAIGPSAADVGAVHVCTSSPGGLVALDAAGTPLHDALLGTHGDSAADAEWLLSHTDGGADAWLAASGVLPTAGSTVALLSFLHRTDGAAWQAMARCTLPVGLLAERLGAGPSLDVFGARGTAVADRHEPQSWRTDLLRAVDADRDWLATLPPIVDPTTPVGTLDASIADAMGLPRGGPVHLGSIIGG